MNIMTDEERVKNKILMKVQLFWPGTEGQRDAALNLSDTALFGQVPQGKAAFFGLSLRVINKLSNFA